MTSRRLLASAVPLLVFALSLFALQAWSGRPDWELPLRTLAAAAALVLAARLVPWTALLRRVRPGSRLFPAALYLWMLRHFTRILLQESRRVLLARRLAAPRSFRAGWFRSLACAVSAIVIRVLLRAERFYAAQLLREIGR